MLTSGQQNPLLSCSLLPPLSSGGGRPVHQAGVPCLVQHSNLPSSPSAGEGRAAEALGPLPARPPLGLQGLGPGEELPIPGEMSQEAVPGGRHGDAPEAADLIGRRWAAPAPVRARPRGAGRPGPAGTRSLAKGQQRIREQRGGLHPDPHHGGDSRRERDLGWRPTAPALLPGGRGQCRVISLPHAPCPLWQEVHAQVSHASDPAWTVLWRLSRAWGIRVRLSD